ncbi:MAG TPA: glycosyltransferase family 4 protein [Chthoniobacter sp.]|nr:glycosyltransferase family 4 protein [Chthoniobacter sp.]
MHPEPATVSSQTGGSVLFINLWPTSGMKHYSESLMHALMPAAEVIYVRNYESCVKCEALRVQLDPVRLAGFKDVWRIVRTILDRRPRAIHLNSELPILLPLFPLFAFFNSVITLHDAVPHEGESFAKRAFMRVHLALVGLFIRKVIVHSEAIRAQLPVWLQRRTHVLPHVNYQLWAQAKQPPAADGALVVLFFGRLLAYKGLDYLLEAFRKLDPARFTLFIAGEGELPPDVLNTPNIRVIHRFIGDEDLPGVFNQAHVVALPYVAASQSGVAYMALAFERPVIATRVGGLGDVIVDDFNGILVEPRSADQLATALERMADAGTRARLMENVRQQNVSGDEEIRTRLLEVYRT